MLFRTFSQLTLAFLLSTVLATLAQAAPTCLGGPSTKLRLAGAVTTPKIFTPADLAGYKSSKATVTYFSGASGFVTNTFVGVPLYDLITEAGVITDPARKNDQLRKYLVISATDCYQVIVSLAEILPAFGGQQAMVAYATVDAAGIQQPLDDTEGAIKLIMPGDKAGGRDVFHTNSIVVRSAP
jgi:hypothetical protein